MAGKLCSCIPQRYVFAIMGFFATFVGFMIRLSVDLTISHKVNQTITTEPVLYDPYSCPDLYHAVNQSDTNGPAAEKTKGTFDWSTDIQASVSSTYRSAYIMSQFIGGMAADTGGGKKVLAGSMLVSGVATFLLPIAAKLFGHNAAVILRFLTGLAGGTIIPVLTSMMSKWVPYDERALTAAIIFPGALLGQVAASYLADTLILLAGWEAVYYVFGLLALLWFCVWIYTCSSTPNDHPRISESEKEYLNNTVVALVRTTKYDLDPLPWTAFLRCSPFWGCVLGYVAREWAFVTLTTQVPLFMRDVLRLDVAYYALSHAHALALLILPYMCMWVSALLFGFISDMVVAREYCSIRFVRKSTTAIAAIGSALGIILIAYTNCNASLTIFWMVFALMATGAFYSGAMINMLDITPNYAGCMIGVVDNIAINSVVLLPALNKLVVTNALLSQWRILLWVVFVVIIVTLTIFMYYIRADQVWWDDVRKNGYPENWSRGFFTTHALINENGETFFKPLKDTKSNDHDK